MDRESFSFQVSPAPHLHSGESTPRVMRSVLIALLPASCWAVYLFGLPALTVILVAVVSSVLAEAAFQKLTGRPVTVADGSAALTGLLLALNLPSSSPWWMVVVGSLVAVVIAKQVYGGLGQNPFNPALVGRVFLLISFPLQMTTWPVPHDTVTAATPLGTMKTDLLLNGRIDPGIGRVTWETLKDPLLGNVGGCLGEVSVILLVIGGGYLLARKTITWHIPFSYLVTVGILTGIFWLTDPARFANPLFHLVSGGLILGAFFMATDLVTSPSSSRGMLVFGIGCGAFTVLIRLFGGYPEGVSFAILLMNAATPLLDRLLPPKRFAGG